MSQETILNGTYDNDPSAEKIRLAFDKVNNMFSEIYDKIPLSLSGNQGLVLAVKATEDGFELVSISGGGDLLSTNNLSDLTNAFYARENLGLGDIATTDVTDYATASQGSKADSAIQSITAGTGISIDVTDAQNPVITNNETNTYVTSATFAASTGILTLGLLGGGSVTVNLSKYTVLTIDGYTVKKGSGNTDYNSIEIGDYCNGWDGDSYVAFRVDALPYTTDGNVSYAVNNSIF